VSPSLPSSVLSSSILLLLSITRLLVLRPTVAKVLFLAGVTLTIGPKRTLKFFIKPRNHKGSACFLGGLTLVFVGWPFIGMCVEGYGFLVLFSAFFPTVLIFLKRLPVIGTFLSFPGVKHFVTAIAGSAHQTLPV
jgi:predicted small integral membrane protein